MVKTSKKPKTPDEDVDVETIDPEQINEIAKDFVDHVGGTIVNVFATCMVVKTVCKVAEISVKAIIR